MPGASRYFDLPVVEDIPCRARPYTYWFAQNH